MGARCLGGWWERAAAVVLWRWTEVDEFFFHGATARGWLP